MSNASSPSTLTTACPSCSTSERNRSGSLTQLLLLSHPRRAQCQSSRRDSIASMRLDDKLLKTELQRREHSCNSGGDNRPHLLARFGDRTLVFLRQLISYGHNSERCETVMGEAEIGKRQLASGANIFDQARLSLLRLRTATLWSDVQFADHNVFSCFGQV